MDGLDARLDVLTFEGKEALSRPFRYTIEFTSGHHPASVLARDASFSLCAAPSPLKLRGYPPAMPPLRTLHGVITQ